MLCSSSYDPRAARFSALMMPASGSKQMKLRSRLGCPAGVGREPRLWLPRPVFAGWGAQIVAARKFGLSRRSIRVGPVEDVVAVDPHLERDVADCRRDRDDGVVLHVFELDHLRRASAADLIATRDICSRPG